MDDDIDFRIRNPDVTGFVKYTNKTYIIPLIALANMKKCQTEKLNFAYYVDCVNGDTIMFVGKSTASGYNGRIHFNCDSLPMSLSDFNIFHEKSVRCLKNNLRYVNEFVKMDATIEELINNDLIPEGYLHFYSGGDLFETKGDVIFHSKNPTSPRDILIRDLPYM
jgi:hypothetical protein